MTALIVIGCIILFFAILLFSPVILRFSYKDGKMRAKVQYVLIIIDFSPEKLAKRAAKRAEKATKEEYKKQKAEEETEGAVKKEKAASDTVKTVWSLVKASKHALDTIRRHLVIYKIKSSIVAGGGDAAQTAQNYAMYCTLVSNGLGVLDSLFVVKEPQISIRPDFLREKTCAEIAFRIRIAPWYLLCAGIDIGIKFLKVIQKNKTKRQEVKGGNSDGQNKRNKRTKQHESASH